MFQEACVEFCEDNEEPSDVRIKFSNLSIVFHTAMISLTEEGSAQTLQAKCCCSSPSWQTNSQVEAQIEQSIVSEQDTLACL